jgi:hypothetical protein
MWGSEAEKEMSGNYWLTPMPSMTPIAPNLMRLDTPVVWVDGNGKQWSVPVGFITDGASLPWLITAIWDRWEPRTLRAAILHDFAYSYHTYGTKDHVDKRFYNGLCADKWSHSLTYYRAVKWGGWYAWNLQRNVRQG